MADGPIRDPLQVHVVADLIEVDGGLFQVGLQLPVLLLYLFLASNGNGGARINEPHHVVVFEPHQHQAAPAGGAATKCAGGVRHVAVEFLLRFAVMLVDTLSLDLSTPIAGIGASTPIVTAAMPAAKIFVFIGSSLRSSVLPIGRIPNHQTIGFNN